MKLEVLDVVFRNIEHLLSRWEIGCYLSAKIKQEGWGQATIDRLVDYIHANAPEERGYGCRNLYNMVAVYEAFTASDFEELLERCGNRIVQTHLHNLSKCHLDNSFLFPPVLALTTFSNLLEIANRTRSAQERLFYIVYAFRERLNTLDLRKRLVDDAYSTVLGSDRRTTPRRSKPRTLTPRPSSPIRRSSIS